MLTHHIPASTQPKLGTLVATIVHERQVLTAVHETIRKRKRPEERLMARTFIVVVKAVAGMTDGDRSTPMELPASTALQYIVRRRAPAHTSAASGCAQANA